MAKDDEIPFLFGVATALAFIIGLVLAASTDWTAVPVVIVGAIAALVLYYGHRAVGSSASPRPLTGQNRDKTFA